MPTQYLHLNFSPATAGWIHRLMSRLRTSCSTTLRTRFAGWARGPLSELALALATKEAIRNRVVRRLNGDLYQLHQDMLASGDLDKYLSENAAFTPPNGNLLYDICAGVDSFYFESRSIYEITGQFVTEFCNEILGQAVREADLINALRAADLDVQWIDWLREDRKLFFHQTAPWIALEVHSLDPLECKLIVMKENLHEFTDPETFITLDQMRAVFGGLDDATGHLYGWLIERIEEFEAADCQ